MLILILDMKKTTESITIQFTAVLIRAFEVALLVVAEIVLWVLIDRPKHLQFNSVLFYAMNTTHSQTSMF